MPITSQQVGGMIGGQQAMFGNFASYSQQISPMAMGGQRGPMPTYPNPMAGSTQSFAPPPMYSAGADDFGIRAMSAVGNVGLPALGTAGMIGGMMLPGAAGTVAGMADPWGAGYQGLRSGLGVGQAGGWGKALGGIARGGIGSIARAGIAGLGGAALAAAGPLALMQAGQYSVGQMVEGAQFQNQVGGFLQNNFRHLNAGSETGFGFGRQERNQISDVIRALGHKEIMSTPQEMMRIMEQGTSMGMFRAVQDAESFKTKFTGMVKTLKEVAKTMNTTLEGAMPFLGEARRMGFWTPQDITGHATTAQNVATNAGVSVAQAQGMMGQGASMARSMGGFGMHGAAGMARTMGLVGGAQRSGVISERMMSEMTGGLMGPEATQAFATQMAQGTARFARSSHGRWMMAALGGKGFKGLDAGALARLRSGTTNLSDIRSQASRNIGREGAANFVMNEETMRGQLMAQGPEVQMGLVRAAVGERIHGSGGMDKLYTRRMVQRMFGVGGRQADAIAKMAREMPQIMEDNKRRTASMMDQMERNRERMMDSGIGEFTRGIGKWWDQQIRKPLQEAGASLSNSISETWRDATDTLVGRTLHRHRFKGIGSEGIRAINAYAGGDSGALDLAFGSAGASQQIAMGGGDGLVGNQGWFLRRNGMATEGAAAQEALQQQGASLRSTISGGVTNFSAGGMGWSGREAAMESLGGARGAVNSNSFRMAAAMMRQGMHSGAQMDRRGDGSGRSAMQFGEMMVKAIERGDKGFDDPGLKQLLAGAGSMREKVMRLSTAQRQAKGGFGFGQVDLSTELEDVQGGMDRGEIQDNVGEFIDDAQSGLAGAASVSWGIEGWQPRSHDADDIQDLVENKKTGPAFKQAMKLMQKAQTVGGERGAKLEARAMGLLQGIGARDDISRDQRQLIADLTNPDHPRREQIKKKMAMTGKGYQAKMDQSFKDVIKRRGDRMMRSLGDRADDVFGRLEEMRPEGKRSMGEIIRGITKKGAGVRDVVSGLQELTDAAMDMEADELGQAAAMFEGVAGAEHIQTALSDAAGLSAFSKELTGKKGMSRGDAGNLMRMAAGQSVTVTGQQMRAIRGDSKEKAEKAREEILSKIAGEDSKKSAEAMLTAIGRKDKDEALLLARQGVVKRGARGLAETDKEKISDRMKRTEAGEIFGQVGSQTGIHVELTRQTTILERIANKGNIFDKKTFNPEEKPKGTE